MKKKIQTLLLTNSCDRTYQIMAGRAGLFGIAFFGHKGTKPQKDKLRRIWKRILTIKTPAV